jgi:hypothetical protein
VLALASALILRSESRGAHDHTIFTRILLSQIRDSPNLEGQVPVFISPRNRVARLYPQAPPSPPTTRRAAVEVFDQASTEECITGLAKSELKLLYDWRFPAN